VFGTTVFDRAKERGWSDSELARRLGISQELVSKCHLGRRSITYTFVRASLRLFKDEGLSFSDLFWVDEESLEEVK
jgi:transcriptional regulator with XRE-family HTH domain